MVLKNKKAEINKLIVYPAIFSLICTISIFVAYLMFVVGNNYIAMPMVYNVSPLMGYDNITTTGVQQAGDFYYSFNLQIIDYGFLLDLFLFTAQCLIMSYFARSYNYFSFLSLLLYGLMVLLFVVSIISVFSSWIYNLMIDIFPSVITNLPLFNWFMNNVGAYTFFLAISMLLINQLDFNLINILSRKRKEQEFLENDEA